MATERIPLTQPIESRSASFTKDSRSVNCVFETRNQKREFIKRPGLVKATDIVSVTPPAYKQSQGLAEFNNKLIAMIDNTVYKINPSTYAVSTLGTTSTSTKQSYFVKNFLNNYLMIQNRNNGYLLKQDDTFTTIDNTYVISASIVNGGNGYSEGAVVTFSAPVSGTTATGTVVVESGVITGVTMTNKGSGYTVAPSVTFTPATTKTPTATGSAGAYTITVSSATGLYVNMSVSGTGIDTNARVVKVSGTTITLSVANTGSVSGTITFTDTGIFADATATLNSFPAGPYVTGLVFLDNYIFIGTANDNRIYNCNLGDPTSWNALGYISFEQSTGNLVGIAKHLNYLVAFGEWSTQLLYDNAITAPASPLAYAQSYTSEVGCANGDSIAQTDQTVFWIGTSKVRGRSVYCLDGTSPIRVSTANIERFLEASDMSQVSSYTYKFNGHLLYILTLHDLNVTIVYDATEKVWYQWTMYSISSSDQPNPGSYYENYFRPTFYAEVNATPYVLDDDRGTLYYLSTTQYSDNGASIYCRAVTDIKDNGTTKRKFFNRLEIVGDKVAGTMQMRHTGDDYKTWSSYRSVDLNASRSQLYLGGQDRRRAWEFLCTDNVPLRIDGAEIDFRIGEMDQEQQVGGGR
jgi:hypothetical protein